MIDSEQSEYIGPLLSNQNMHIDTNVQNLQRKLMNMGFDLDMINKVIYYFNIKTEEQAIDYLVQNNGLWTHPFIPKMEEKQEKEGTLMNNAKEMIGEGFHKLKSAKIIGKNNNEKYAGKLDGDNQNGNLNEDICDICGDNKDLHSNKEIPKVFYDLIKKKEGLSEDINTNKNKVTKYKSQDIVLDININNDNITNNKEIKEGNESIKENDGNNIDNIGNNSDSLCGICLDEFENPREVPNCKHRFCLECLHSYLVNRINTNNVDKMPCPTNKCPNDNMDKVFFISLLSESEYYKYRLFVSKNEIARDNRKMFCPHCDSYADMQGNLDKYDCNKEGYVKSSLTCQNNHVFCSCGRPTHEGDCYRDGKEYEEFLKKEKIKNCPKCGFLIKKNAGCNHMTCGNPACKYEFCWLCMEQSLPDHYNYGPCKGKQFIDPDSFLYRFSEEHPCLGCIINFIKGLIEIIIFVLCFFLLPCLGLIWITFYIFYLDTPEGVFENFTKITKFIYFITLCALYIPLQVIMYMLYIIGLTCVGMYACCCLCSCICGGRNEENNENNPNNENDFGPNADFNNIDNNNNERVNNNNDNAVVDIDFNRDNNNNDVKLDLVNDS